MHQFVTRKDGFKEVRKKSLLPQIIIDIAIILTWVYILPINSSASDADYSWIFTLVLMIPVLVYSHYMILKRKRKIFESFQLTITEDSIVREQLNTPTLTIPKNSVREILKLPNGSICIIGESKMNAIGVPAQTERLDELERILAEIKSLRIKTPGHWLRYLYAALVMLAMGLFGVGLLNEDRIIFSISAVCMCGFLITSFILAHRSKNTDRSIKRLSYGAFIPILAILASMIMKWLPG